MCTTISDHFDILVQLFHCILFFCDTGVWTQGLMLVRQMCYHLSHSASPSLYSLYTFPLYVFFESVYFILLTFNHLNNMLRKWKFLRFKNLWIFVEEFGSYCIYPDWSFTVFLSFFVFIFCFLIQDLTKQPRVALNCDLPALASEGWDYRCVSSSLGLFCF
jgi:hypothetical protein